MMESSVKYQQPGWLWSLLGSKEEAEGCEISVRNIAFKVVAGIARNTATWSETQSQTQASFAYIWSERERFQSLESLQLLRDWYKENYGSVEDAPWWDEYGSTPLLLDAGCGGGISASECFGDRINKVRYLGVDISTAVEAAAERFLSMGLSGAFIQTSLNELPLDDNTVDVIFAQGVLHHTDSTEVSLKSLARKLKKGGRFLFYVYGKKGPVREFTDDYIRQKIVDLPPEAAWESMKPLTKLGALLGEMDVEIDVPETIDLLEIPAGKINLQRLFYWHVFKAFYHSDLTFDEMNHINLDWYVPVNCHRQTPDDVRRWCDEANLVIEREYIQESGISMVARKNN